MKTVLSETSDKHVLGLENYSLQQVNDQVITPRILVFELGYLGHYPSYIRNLARYWCQHQLPGYLDIVVSPSFKEHHSDVLAIASECKQGTLRFVVINEAEQAHLVPRESPLKRAHRSLQEWRLLQKYTKLLNTSHCLLLYFDSFQTAIASGKHLPCKFSGIYFRPTFHYNTFADYQPTRKERFQHWRERTILPKLMRHRQLANIFCLDPYAVPYINQLEGQGQAKYLPDPVEITQVSNEAIVPFRQSLGIQPNRTVFLLFGALYDARKGLDQVLDALEMLSVDECKQICLLLVGTLIGDTRISDKIHTLQQKLPVQIILRDQFIPPEEIQLYFGSSDVVLATYQCHVGMSGILVQAAAAQKPLLSSNYGLMGEVTRHWQLGLTLDATSPPEIADNIARVLSTPLNELGNPTKMKAFALQNSAEHFADVIFKSTIS